METSAWTKFSRRVGRKKTDRVVGLFLVRADFSDAEIILRHAAYLRVKEDRATRALKR